MLILLSVLLGLFVVVALVFALMYRKTQKQLDECQSEYNDYQQRYQNTIENKRYEESQELFKQHIGEEIQGKQDELNSTQEQINKANSKLWELGVKQSEAESQYKEYVALYQMEKERIEQELQAYKEFRDAVAKNHLEEEAKKKEQDFYRISLSEDELEDIHILKEVIGRLHNPIVIHRVIYTNYYDKKLKELFDRVIEKQDPDRIGGIYKITNIKNDKCYIGRTNDFKARWTKHAKDGTHYNGEIISGLLHKAIETDGIENFTFDILQACDETVQAQREKDYITLYNSILLGYNEKIG